MPAPRRRIPREIFETRSHSWHAVGLGEELEAKPPKRPLGWLLLALGTIAATLVVYSRRHELFPATEPGCAPRGKPTTGLMVDLGLKFAVGSSAPEAGWAARRTMRAKRGTPARPAGMSGVLQDLG